ncbi:hypothetical protein QR680_001083 [Steinernema hermaphroditum]|uniref:Uncharacterized protein n=1 Tax=Steinernema hermaphroditum TaxID=289476 RepID=A0AA39LF78_9BILA|nr:hypothetical protein QR680_001083 [Steinernema hermaphroditum]
MGDNFARRQAPLMRYSSADWRASFLISRSRSTPNLDVSAHYKPQWDHHLRSPYYFYDDHFGKSIWSRYNYPVTYRSGKYTNVYPYLVPNYFSQPFRYLSWLDYPPYYPSNSYRYNDKLSPYQNFVLDKASGWDRERHYGPKRSRFRINYLAAGVLGTMNDYRLRRATSASLIRSSDADRRPSLPIIRNSAPDLPVYDVMRPSWGCRVAGSYYMNDDVYGKYMYNRHYFPTYHSYLYSNFFYDTKTSPYYWNLLNSPRRYKYWLDYPPYSYNYRKYNFALSPSQNYILDRAYNCQRDRYYTTYYCKGGTHYFSGNLPLH